MAATVRGIAQARARASGPVASAAHTPTRATVGQRRGPSRLLAGRSRRLARLIGPPIHEVRGLCAPLAVATTAPLQSPRRGLTATAKAAPRRSGRGGFRPAPTRRRRQGKRCLIWH
jgi:hypothetical protein